MFRACCVALVVSGGEIWYGWIKMVYFWIFLYWKVIYIFFILQFYFLNVFCRVWLVEYNIIVKSRPHRFKTVPFLDKSFSHFKNRVLCALNILILKLHVNTALCLVTFIKILRTGQCLAFSKISRLLNPLTNNHLIGLEWILSFGP